MLDWLCRSFCIARWPHLEFRSQAKPIGIAEQLFDADLRDLAPHQIADGGLVVVENVDKLALGETSALDLSANCVEKVRLDF